MSTIDPAVPEQAEPVVDQEPAVFQEYGTVINLPIGLAAEHRRESVERLNQTLADLITLRDLYKKHHWQISGPDFYHLHLLLDKHAGEVSDLVDTVAERVQLLGGVSIAMGADVAEATRIERPPKGREKPAAQLSRLLDAHEVILTDARGAAEAASGYGDSGTEDLFVSEVVRQGELQVWFLAEHLVQVETDSV